MESWIAIFLPMALLLGRVSGFFAILPIFGNRGIPMTVRAGAAILVTLFLGMFTPVTIRPAGVGVLEAGLMLTGEILYGLALGMAIYLVFQAVRMAGCMAEREMGFATASIIDPVTGEEGDAVSMLFDTAFVLVFLVAGGHRLLLSAIARSYKIFPMGSVPDPSALTEAVLSAGSAMLLFALKLAAPMLAALLVLAVVMALLARALPEMNILMESLPLRVGLGLILAATIVPLMNSFITELADWMNRSLTGSPT
jgi:flagellar biosynthetic protein FliR